MNSRIQELCSRPIAGRMIPRDLNEEPITKSEILDCLLLTAALDREHANQIKQGIEAMMICAPDIADLCKRTLAALRQIAPARLIDHVNLEDRLPEVSVRKRAHVNECERQFTQQFTAAWLALRTMADANPNQAVYLKTAADTLEDSWSPMNPNG